MKFLCTICLFVLFSCSLYAQTPGTTADPLVTKSYLDHLFRFRSIVLPQNTTLKPTPGAIFIIRSGELKLEAPRGKTIVDLTTGKEIRSGVILPLNHLLIVPDSAQYILEAHKLTLMLAAYLEDRKQ